MELLAWGIALLAAAAVLPLLDYQTRDADSVLYAEIAARLSREPLALWIAPEWPPHWYMEGPYREHPVGIFLLPALLARLGYPAGQAAYLVNALYQALTLLLLPRLAATLVAATEARALAWLVQLLPIAFTYRIRANQEPLVLLCLVAALLGTERSRTRPRWVLLTVAALVTWVLAKGALALLGPAACALWLLARRVRPSSPAWWGLGLGVLAVVLVAFGYELSYERVTGEPFLSAYLGRQLGVAAVPASPDWLTQKLRNFVFYLGRIVWFAFPWSLAVIAAAWSGRHVLARAFRADLPADAPAEGARTGLVFTLALTALYLGLFSLSDRRADRYIFPVYYAVGACGAVAALRSLPRFRRVAERAHAWQPLVPVGVWALTFALHLAAGRLLHLPTIKL